MYNPKLLLVLTLMVVSPLFATPYAMNQFEHDYGAIGAEIMLNQGEVSAVRDLFYHKDVATFHFIEGKLLFQRYIDDRPTMAVFVGRGTVRIAVPPRVEQQSMAVVTGDSVVNEELSVCYFHFGDNFDRQVQQAFPSQKNALARDEFRKVKKSLGNRFFSPLIYHDQDNYFQLLQSTYAREDDGYFWASFDRWVYRFDPNSAEEVSILYEFERPSLVPVQAAKFQRKEANRYDNLELSQIDYPLSAQSRAGQIELGGLDGDRILAASISMRSRVNRDSMRLASAFLDPELALDSVTSDLGPVFVMRRKDFGPVGLVLPEYLYRGDEITVTFWYHGAKYAQMFPQFGKQSHQFSDEISVLYPKDADVVTLAASSRQDFDEAREQCSLTSVSGVRTTPIEVLLTGFDTLTLGSTAGVSLSHLWAKEPIKEEFRGILARAFGHFGEVLGAPPGVEEISILEVESSFDARPGLVLISEDNWDEPTGGFYRQAGLSAALQWFSARTNPLSYREAWIEYGISEYLALMFIQEELGNETFFNNLLAKRMIVQSAIDEQANLPLAQGTRIPIELRRHKGAWIVHMIRMLMHDVSDGSDSAFYEFLKEFLQFAAQKEYSNKDFIRIVEDHYGGELDWFFQHWVFGWGIPEYRVSYTVEKDREGWLIDCLVHTSGAGDSFKMPVIWRLDFSQGSIYLRRAVEGREFQFTLGPYDTKPDKVYFNEFLSVLADYEVKKR